MRYSYIAPMLIAVLLFSSGALATAQSSCSGLPCGAIPWPLPEFPVLESPTPWPTSIVTPTLSPTPTTTATLPPTVTPTPTVDIGDISGGIDNINSLLTTTPDQLLGLDGTPVAVGTTAYGDMASNAVTAVSYLKALGGADFGVITPLIQFVISIFLFMLGVKLLEISIPFVAILFGGLRKVVQVVLDFIPF